MRNIQVITNRRKQRNEQWAVKWSDASREFTTCDSKREAMTLARTAAKDRAAVGNVVVMIQSI